WRRRSAAWRAEPRRVLVGKERLRSSLYLDSRPISRRRARLQVNAGTSAAWKNWRRRSPRSPSSPPDARRPASRRSSTYPSATPRLSRLRDNFYHSVAPVTATGLVTAVAPGSATITATSNGRSGAATITVAPRPPPGTVEDLTVDAVTDSSVSLAFTQVTDGGGRPAAYDVRYAVTPI